MAYVDGFVFTVPKKNVKAYKKMAADGKEAWLRHGAIDYKECMGDDLKTKGAGGMAAPMSFTKLTGAKAGDTVWFSFIVFKNKKHRDQVNKKVMAEMSKDADKYKDFVMPFDTAKMAYGGFNVEVGL